MINARFPVSAVVAILFCQVSVLAQQPLSVSDFAFDEPLGSQGATISEVGTNHFKLTLGHAPEHDNWANMAQFSITGNAKGNALRLDVFFGHDKPTYLFNDYSYSYSHDGETWIPIHWKGYREHGKKSDVLVFPEFTEDTVQFGHQVPLSVERLNRYVDVWRESPYVSVHEVGRSLGGRPLLRVTVADTAASQKWIHYYANQHPGEHNSQWRMVGMLEWLLSAEGRPALATSTNHFVFIMSPDAPQNGWYRVNAQGVDMNRSYRVEGSDAAEQAHEAYLWQKDLEGLMASAHPVTDFWSMHTWQGMVEAILIPGPEMGTEVGPWTELRDIILGSDPNLLIEPLRVENYSRSKASHWHQGAHGQFGISAILCEGAGGIFTKEENLESGRILMKSITQYYR
jgi:hypothetical protein